MTIRFRLDDRKAKAAKDKDKTIVRLLDLTIAYLLDAHVTMAKTTFDQLVALCPAVVPYFSHPEWINGVPSGLLLSQKDIELMQEALMPLSGFLFSQYFVCGQLTAFAQECQKNQLTPAGLSPFLYKNKGQFKRH